MAEETIIRVEQMEKNQQELQKILARDREEHRKQMAQMMQVIMRLSREKGVVDDAGSVNIAVRTQGVIEGPMYHPVSFSMREVGTSHCEIPPMVNVVSKTCHPPPFSIPIPSEGVSLIPTCLFQWCQTH